MPIHYLRILLFFLALFFIGNTANKYEKYKPIQRNLVMLTYNIHHGAPDKSDEVNLENIATVIKKSKAELVALQEVDVNVPRSNYVNQVEVLANILGMYSYFSKSIDYNGGEYGVAILSKYPMSNTRNELLPMPSKGEQRSIALATIHLDDGNLIEFASTHLDLNKENRLAQTAFLNTLSKQLNKPLFIGGDYNAQPHSPEMIQLKEEYMLSCMGECPLTIPVINPQRAIDFVVQNKKAASQFKLIEAAAMSDEYASDHLPLRAVYSY